MHARGGVLTNQLAMTWPRGAITHHNTNTPRSKVTGVHCPSRSAIVKVFKRCVRERERERERQVCTVRCGKSSYYFFNLLAAIVKLFRNKCFCCYAMRASLNMRFSFFSFLSSFLPSFLPSFLFLYRYGFIQKLQITSLLLKQDETYFFLKLYYYSVLELIILCLYYSV